MILISNDSNILKDQYCRRINTNEKIERGKFISVIHETDCSIPNSVTLSLHLNKKFFTFNADLRPYLLTRKVMI